MRWENTFLWDFDFFDFFCGVGLLSPSSCSLVDSVLDRSESSLSLSERLRESSRLPIKHLKQKALFYWPDSELYELSFLRNSLVKIFAKNSNEKNGFQADSDFRAYKLTEIEISSKKHLFVGVFWKIFTGVFLRVRRMSFRGDEIQKKKSKNVSKSKKKFSLHSKWTSEILTPMFVI